MRFAGLLAAVVAIALSEPTFGAGTNWMAGLDGRRQLSEITIPGTHDSGARFETWSSTAACQSATIAEQLNFGVRLLDVRCRHVRDTFAIYHGSVDQRLQFTNLVAEVLRFLTVNPSETVVMSIKEEYQARNNTRSFAGTFASCIGAQSNRWWLANSVPMLDAVRGKIVLLRRFPAEVEPGIPAAAWPDNAVFTRAPLQVQDCYRVADPGAKWTCITNALAAAANDSKGNLLHLNFASGYKPGPLSIPNIRIIADFMNPRLDAFFASSPPAHYGCVLMDFADARRTQLIYRSNPALRGAIR